MTGKAEIDLSAPVNPAWAAQFNTVIAAAAPDKKVLTEEDWNAIGAKFTAYTGWKGAKAGAEVEALGLDALKNFAASSFMCSVISTDFSETSSPSRTSTRRIRTLQPSSSQADSSLTSVNAVSA